MSDNIKGEHTKRFTGQNCVARSAEFPKVLARLTHGEGEYLGEYFNGLADPPYVEVSYALEKVLPA
jgi:hypothetical protein